MTDDPKQEDTGAEPATTATASSGESTAEPGSQAADEGKLHQQVDISDVGPCKKHLRVTIERKDIDNRIGEKISEMVGDASVAGFRPGKAPRKLVERRYHKDVADQVKNEVLLVSLQQLAEDHDIAPLSPPDIDPFDIELPDQGPLVYEFEVEVRPQFDLPEYKGLKLQRPVHTYSEEEILAEERRLLTPYGQLVPKTDGGAEMGDYLVADVTISDGDQVVREIKESSFRVEKQLAFRDALASEFSDRVVGARPGESREVDLQVSHQTASEEMRGKSLKARFDIKDLKAVRLPELTHEFLHNFGVHTPEQLRELVQVILERRLEYTQRRSARQQILEKMVANASWELPEDLLMRQARKALARRVMEMRADGIAEEEIQAQQRLLSQNILESTAVGLKEHFVLQKIAEVEKIEVTEDDINDEIERLASQNDESPRRLRARLEKDDLLDTLAAEMIERKALDLILESAEYEDVPLHPEQQTPSLATVEDQATPGELQDLSQQPAEEAGSESSGASS